MGFLRKLLGGSPDREKLERAAAELADQGGKLRESVSALGQEVWGMVETGDALGALVHGAQRAKFHRDIEDGEKHE